MFFGDELLLEAVLLVLKLHYGSVPLRHATRQLVNLIVQVPSLLRELLTALLNLFGRICLHVSVRLLGLCQLLRGGLKTFGKSLVLLLHLVLRPQVLSLQGILLIEEVSEIVFVVVVELSDPVFVLLHSIGEFAFSSGLLVSNPGLVSQLFVLIEVFEVIDHLFRLLVHVSHLLFEIGLLLLQLPL